jgi:hypothetical protein
VWRSFAKKKNCHSISDFKIILFKTFTLAKRTRGGVLYYILESNISKPANTGHFILEL